MNIGLVVCFGDGAARRTLPVLRCRGAVALPPVFKPVADLRRGESGRLRQLALFRRVRVGVLEVPLAQQVAGALLEAVRLLLAVPDGAGKRELLAHAVLVDGPERPAAQPLRLLVVRLEPHGLEARVRVLRELVALQDLVEVLEVAGVEGDERARSQHRLVPVERLAGGRVDGQRPEEAAESLDVSALLQRLAYLGDLLRREVKRRQGGQGGPQARAREHRRTEPARYNWHRRGAGTAGGSSAPLAGSLPHAHWPATLDWRAAL